MGQTNPLNKKNWKDLSLCKGLQTECSIKCSFFNFGRFNMFHRPLLQWLCCECSQLPKRPSDSYHVKGELFPYVVLPDCHWWWIQVCNQFECIWPPFEPFPSCLNFLCCWLSFLCHSGSLASFSMYLFSARSCNTASIRRFYGIQLLDLNISDDPVGSWWLYLSDIVRVKNKWELGRRR